MTVDKFLEFVRSWFRDISDDDWAIVRRRLADGESLERVKAWYKSQTPPEPEGADGVGAGREGA